MHRASLLTTIFSVESNLCSYNLHRPFSVYVYASLRNSLPQWVVIILFFIIKWEQEASLQITVGLSIIFLLCVDSYISPPVPTRFNLYLWVASSLFKSFNNQGVTNPMIGESFDDYKDRIRLRLNHHFLIQACISVRNEWDVKIISSKKIILEFTPSYNTQLSSSFKFEKSCNVKFE